jgi:DNA-binding IclR family transcriptional regulator
MMQPDSNHLVALKPPAKTSSDRKGIQSIEIGFRIVDFLVNAGKPVPLKDIAKGTSIAPSNLNFYLVSLVKVGIASQEQSTGFYGLGPYTLKLGLAGLEQFDILAVARDRMVDLANSLGHSVFLGVWGNNGPTIVHRVDAVHSRPVFELRIGSVLPVLRSALGRIFMAHLPEQMTSTLVDAEMADAVRLAAAGRSTDVPRNRLELQALIAQIQKSGMSRCRSGLLSDFTAMSAPIFDHSGTIISALTVMGQIGVLDDNLDGPSARAVKELADLVSADAGQRVKSYMPYMRGSASRIA